MTNTCVLKAALLLLALGMQPHAIRCTAQTTAKTILDKAAANIGRSGGVSAKFSTGGGGSLSGTLIIKGNKFKATTSAMTLWYDGTTQWVYLHSTEEVNVTTPTDAQSLNPYKFLNLYKQGYDLSSAKSGTGYQVHLTAQSSARAIKEAYVTVSAGYEPTQIKVLTSDGWTVINISDIKAGNYADTVFRFNAADYPNAEIVDLR